MIYLITHVECVFLTKRRIVFGCITIAMEMVVSCMQMRKVLHKCMTRNLSGTAMEMVIFRMEIRWVIVHIHERVVLKYGEAIGDELFTICFPIMGE
jgi:hypothetical protein